MTKKSENVHFRMDFDLRDFMRQVTDEADLSLSAIIRYMLNDWRRLGPKGTAEAIRQLRANKEQE